MAADKVPQMAADAILLPSSHLPEYSTEVRGYDWSQGVNYEGLLNSYATSGFQATSYGQGVQEINRMVGGAAVQQMDVKLV